MGHGVARVEAEVHQQLSEARGVEAHARALGVEVRVDAHGVADHAAQQAQGLAARGVDVDLRGPRGLAAAEHHQRAGEGDAAVGRVAHVADALLLRRRERTLGENLQVREQGREHVVEVVDDAAGEAPEGLHPPREVRLGPRREQRRLRRALAGHVAHHGDEVAHLPVAVAHRGDPLRDQHLRVVAAAHPGLPEKVLLAGEVQAQRVDHLRVGRGAPQDPRAPPQDLAAGIPRERLERGVHIEDPSRRRRRVRRGDHHRLAGRVPGVAQKAVLRLQRAAPEPLLRQRLPTHPVDVCALCAV
ncbi:MAG: hypothetical protein U0325_27950 [Polyangiales bacterium]